MADTEQAVPSNPLDTPTKQDQIVKLRPTLFIGVGGTGLEVMLRVRRRILNAVWGTSNPVRVDSLPEFPVAQFLHFDLDQGQVVDSGKSQTTDPLVDLVKLTDDEKLVENFDIERYSSTDDDLARFPHIASWSPLTPKKIRELQIDPSKGAGQIRGIARLYFFDKYPKIRDRIRNKLNSLKAGLSKEQQLQRLGLELDQSKFRIVVIGSVAGGTGSGTFLDMGWLAGKQAKEAVASAETELLLFMPTGYANTNKERTEANGYASLMELESCMRGGSDFVRRWDEYEGDTKLAAKPFDEVFLIDSGNLAAQHTDDRNDVYDMVADALFEDFASADFANRKRAIAVNQRQHKISPYSPPVPENRFGDMKLSYYKGFSAFGQAMLDTQQSARADMRGYRWTAEMLKAFFGVGLGSAGNRAGDKQRDEFMAANVGLSPISFSEFPDFSAKVDLKLSSGDFLDYTLAQDLLEDRHGAMLAGVQQKVDAAIEKIAMEFDRDEWPTQVRDTLKQLERDAVRDQDTATDVAEDRVIRKRNELLKTICVRMREQLFGYLDNKEFGGLEYVLSLVGLVKDRLENSATGMTSVLNKNAARYREIRDALKTYECERLLGNLEQTRGKALLTNKDKQARAILDQMKLEIGNYLKFHLRAKASHEAVLLLQDVSKWLGDNTGVDQKGNAQWNGFVGELQAGRASVLEMLSEIDRRIAIIGEDVKKDHATYIRIEVQDSELPLPPAARLRDWADEAFKDFGGSRKLFPMLADPKQRASLIMPLRRKADEHIAQLMNQSSEKQLDPLVEKLKTMMPVERQRRFSELLQRSMPWIDAYSDRYFRPKADQYKCYIGVGDAKQWEQFREEVISQVPTMVGLTGQQVAFVTAGTRGRAVCYCELSGIPLTNLRGLDAWRTSYRKETELIPLHTQSDATKFTHPLVPSSDELVRLADDFKMFLLAVVLRVLVRDPSTKISPPGQYQFAVGRGDLRRMGNERAFRLNGLPPNYREQIVAAVNAKLDELGASEFAALAALADFYATGVYKPKLVPDETGTEIPRKGFAAAVAENLAKDLRERAKRLGLSDADCHRKEEIFFDRVARWTDVVERSDQDAYAWEVREPEEGEGARFKRVAQKEFFDKGWVETAITGTASGAGVPLPPTLATSANVFQYHLITNGVQSGPHPFATVQQWLAARQLAPTTIAWREGVVAWVPLLQLPEFAAAPTGAAPPPPPPGAI